MILSNLKLFRFGMLFLILFALIKTSIISQLSPLFWIWVTPLLIIGFISWIYPSKKFFQSVGFVLLMYFMFDSLSVFGVPDVSFFEIIEVSIIVILFINSVFIASTLKVK